MEKQNWAKDKEYSGPYFLYLFDHRMDNKN